MQVKAFSQLVILLSLICSSYAAKNVYIFCNGSTSGAIIVELDAVINTKEGNTTTRLNNIKQNGAPGPCTSDNKRSFLVDFESAASLKIVIENINGTVSLDELEVKTGKAMGTDSVSQELSKSNEYYVCNRPITYSLPSDSPDVELSVTFNTIKLQGFNVVNNSFSPEYATCPAASPTTAPSTSIKTTLKTTTKKITTTAPTKTPTTTTKKTPTTIKTTLKTTTKTTQKTTTKTTQKTTTKMPTTTPTKAPSTTTKKVSTTISPVTPTTRPLTTSSPPGKLAKLDMMTNGTVCLLVEFSGNLSFEYNTTKGKKTYVHAIDGRDVMRIEGSCKGDSPYVKGILSMGCAVEFRFSKNPKLQSTTRRLLAASFEYALTNLTVTYDTSKPPGAKNGGVKSQSVHPKDVQASSGEIYRCNAVTTLFSEGTTTLKVKNFKAGAFSPNQKNEKVCAADSKGNNVVPIVVGVILACLVVIIIVAYLIGRRRNREGYQSV